MGSLNPVKRSASDVKSARRACAAQTKEHDFAPGSRISVREESYSPRLIPPSRLLRRDEGAADQGCGPAVILVADAPDRSKSDERFCMDGPIFGDRRLAAQRAGSSSGSRVSFATHVARLQIIVGQASMVLSDRLVPLENKARVTELEEQHCRELSGIANSVVAGAYHVQKWAAILRRSASQRPPRPVPCEAVDEAFAIMRGAIPRLTASIAIAQSALVAIAAEHGAEAEERVRSLGIPIDDVLAIGPHLDHQVVRVTRLTFRLKPLRIRLREFVPAYFAPVISRKLAVQLLPFLGL